MLVLSRLPGERLRIGHDIVVEVIELRGNKVRLGITAPKEVPVHREEIYAQIYESHETVGGEAGGA